MRARGGTVKNMPAAALTLLGVLITVLGLLAAGNLAIVVIGLLALVAAGVLEALTRRPA
jgi:uncharacterized membrane protein